MDPRLMEVARNGDIDGLYGLLGEDPFILENVEKIPFTNTPLHWAVLAGHTRFVEEITNLKPSFSWKLNQDGFSPLHLASSSGELEIGKVLLKDEGRLKKLMEAMNVDGSLSTSKGKEKRTPLHCAAIAGHVDVLEELLSNCLDSITALTVRKETALHLAVKNSRVEALKVLVNWTGKHCYNGILRWKDEDGNTILHLAASSGQYEMVEIMLHSSCVLVRNAVLVNARNNAGQTALDLLMHLPSGADREKMETTLCNVGAKNGVELVEGQEMENQQVLAAEGQDIESQQVPAAEGQDIESQQVAVARSCVMKWLRKSSKSQHWFRYFSLKVDKDTPSDIRNALLVVIVLIATATFQTGLNPPGGYWDNTSINSTGDDADHSAGEPIWATYAPKTYNLVMLFNFAGFVLSLVLSYNLTQGYPLRGPLLLALILMLLTYSWSTPIFYNGPSGADYFLKPGNKMLWLPVVLAVIIWAITANWMGQIWWKLGQIWRKFLPLTGRLSHD